MLEKEDSAGPAFMEKGKTAHSARAIDERSWGPPHSCRGEGINLERRSLRGGEKASRSEKGKANHFGDAGWEGFKSEGGSG